MIFGIGVDLLDSRRIARTLERFGDHFTDRLLMPQERAQLARTRRPERFIAMRFAAKEAIVKAMGTGFAHGVWIRDVGVVQNEWGKPEVVFSERGDRVRRRMGIGEGHVTLTDEAGLIMAVAVLMKAAKRGKPRGTRGSSGSTEVSTGRKSAARKAVAAGPARRSTASGVRGQRATRARRGASR